MIAEALKALDEALYEVSGGVIVRGGALTASPDERVRRRIRVFKHLDAERGYLIEKEQGEERDAALGAEEFRLMLGGGGADRDRQTALEDVFAASG